MIRLVTVLKEFCHFLLDIWNNRYLIIQLTKRDFQNKYLGSYIGLPWAFIKPLAIVFVMWFAFTYGLKVGLVDDSIPFAMWLVIGLIPWFYVAENLTGSVHCLMEYSFLIKNISFRPSFIPLIKILTNSLIHLFFIVVLMLISLSYGYYPSVHWFQIIYYMAGSILLSLGLSWGLSAIQIFIRDTGHLLDVSIQFLFWGTPIIWSYKMLPEQFYFIEKLNPFFYLVEGYRNTFIYKTWFFNDWSWGLYFWFVTAIVFVSGAIIFKKLKPHFADVM